MIFKGSIARGTVAASAVLALRLVVQTCTLLLLASFAAFAAISAIAVLMGPLASFGMHLTVLRELSVDPERRTLELPMAFGTSLLCSVIVVMVYLLLVMCFFRGQGIGFAVATAIGIAELVLQPLLLIAASEQQAYGLIARSQLLLAAPLMLRMAAIIAIFFANLSNPLLVYAVVSPLAVLIGLLIAYTVAGTAWPSPGSWRVLPRARWADNASHALLGLTACGPSEIDKPLATRLMTLDAAGSYAAASRVTGALVTRTSSRPALRENLSAIYLLWLRRMGCWLGTCYGLLRQGSNGCSVRAMLE
jgi:O-antigen/teichoic acid export membrane protein